MTANFPFSSNQSLDAEALNELVRSPFWGLLHHTAISKIVAEGELRLVPAGEMLSAGGTIPTTGFLIRSGKVRMLDEQEKTIALLEQQDGFGLWHGLLRQSCGFRFRAVEPTEVLTLAVDKTQAVINSTPELQKEAQAQGLRFITGMNLRKQVAVLGINPLSQFALEKHTTSSPVLVKDNSKVTSHGFKWGVLRQGILKLSFEGCHLGTLKPGMLFSTQVPDKLEVLAEGPAWVHFLSDQELERLAKDTPGVKRLLRQPGVVSATSHTELVPAEIPVQKETPSRQPIPRRPSWKRIWNRFPVVLQMDENDCGPSCLTSILHFYGQDVPRIQVRRMFKAGLIGVSLADLAHVADRFGFIPKALATSYDRLASHELPLIAHLKSLHFVVVYQLTPTHCLLGDPAKGKVRLTRAEFESLWSGKVLVLRPTIRLRDIAVEKGGVLSKIRRLSTFAEGHKKTFLEILIASASMQVLNFAPALFSQILFDRILPYGSASTLNILAIGMVLLYALQATVSFVRAYLLGYASRGIDLVMSSEFHEHLMALPVAYFQTRSSGDVLKRFYDNQKMRRLFTDQVIPLALDFLTATISFLLIIQYNWQMVFVVFGMMAVYLTIVFASSSTMRKSWQKTSEAEAEVNSLIFESIASITIIKALAAEHPVANRLFEALGNALSNSFKREMTGNLVGSFGMMTFSYVNLFLFWFGVHQVFAGNLTPGAMMALMALCSNLISPISRMAGNWMMVQEAMLILERLFEVIEEPPEVTPAASQTTISAENLSGTIEFENVSFAYPGRQEKNALQNATLHIPAKTTVAIVGRSGAGKTTFVNLLLRFYEPTSGRILIDGIDIRTLSLHEMRRQIGIVTQDVVLFRGTIRENIAFAHPEASLQQVVEAAKLAGIHEFIMSLPGGYEAKVGERGQSLSGGQKQRISIARAILGKPRILIFDEATSSLDNESEAQIQKALLNILGKCTTILIAHRLSTVRNAEKILVLDKGNILEQGTHDELMTAGGLYQYLYSVG